MLRQQPTIVKMSARTWDFGGVRQNMMCLYLPRPSDTPTVFLGKEGMAGYLGRCPVRVMGDKKYGTVRRVSGTTAGALITVYCGVRFFFFFVDLQGSRLFGERELCGRFCGSIMLGVTRTAGRLGEWTFYVKTRGGRYRGGIQCFYLFISGCWFSSAVLPR